MSVIIDGTTGIDTPALSADSFTVDTLNSTTQVVNGLTVGKGNYAAERSFNAAMDSVNLLNASKPEQMTDAEWVDTVKRNKDHLLIQLAKPEFYKGYDLKPLKDAVK